MLFFFFPFFFTGCYSRNGNLLQLTKQQDMEHNQHQHFWHQGSSSCRSGALHYLQPSRTPLQHQGSRRCNPWHDRKESFQLSGQSGCFQLPEYSCWVTALSTVEEEKPFLLCTTAQFIFFRHTKNMWEWPELLLWNYSMFLSTVQVDSLTSLAALFS